MYVKFLGVAACSLLLSTQLHAESPLVSGVGKPTDKLASPMERVQKPMARAQDLTEGVTRDFSTVRQIGQNTVVTGAVIHYGDVIDVAPNAEAVGAQLQAPTPGKVSGNITLIQHGNVTALGATSANAAGTQVKAGEIGNLNVNSAVFGNTNAVAVGGKKTAAQAVASQIKGATSDSTRLGVNSNTTGSINAAAGSK